MTYYSKSEKETQKIAGNLALKLINFIKPTVVVLEGELGAGKTTFVKGFAKTLGIRSKIKSPTFNLMKKYKFFLSGKSKNTPNQNKHNLGQAKTKSQTNSKFQILNSEFLIHLDCYRVRDHRDLATLDLKNIFNTPGNIVLIEWPERISKILPKKLVRVHIDHVSKYERKVRIEIN